MIWGCLAVQVVRARYEPAAATVCIVVTVYRCNID
jgi:hypothetical protein